MKNLKVMSVLMLTAVLTACGSGVGTPPSEYTATIIRLKVTSIVLKLLVLFHQEMNAQQKQKK